jgi:hypothetical protein
MDYNLVGDLPLHSRTTNTGIKYLTNELGIDYSNKEFNFEKKIFTF